MRVSRGNKGSYFVFARADADAGAGAGAEAGARAEQRAWLRSPPPAEDGDAAPAAAAAAAPSREPIVICPAQFGTKGDYDALVAALERAGHPTFVAPLRKLSWITGLAPSFFSADFWLGELKPAKVLRFYYDALDEAVAAARAAHPGAKVHLVAHSIGGWVARAYLGEEATARVAAGEIASLTTLGTPHAAPPPDSAMAAADQTRGLLKYVNERFPGAHREPDGVRYVAVGAGSVRGALPFALPFGLGGGGGEDAADGGRDDDGDGVAWLERALGWASYFALCGDGGARGDGITPLAGALLEGEGVRHVVLDGDGAEQRDGAGVYHADFLPSPGPSTRLRGTPWYGSPGALDAWLPLLQEPDGAGGNS